MSFKSTFRKKRLSLFAKVHVKESLVNTGLCKFKGYSALLNNILPLFQGFIQLFWEQAPGQNWEKIIGLMSKLGKIIDIKHNYGSKIYPKNQVYAKYKCLSNILIWVIDSHKL